MIEGLARAANREAVPERVILALESLQIGLNISKDYTVAQAKKFARTSRIAMSMLVTYATQGKVSADINLGELLVNLDQNEAAKVAMEAAKIGINYTATLVDVKNKAKDVASDHMSWLKTKLTTAKTLYQGSELAVGAVINSWYSKFF